MSINRAKLLKINKTGLYITILIVFLIAYVFYLLSFLMLDHSSPGGDDMHHLRFVYDYYYNLKNYGILTFFLRPVTFYPPFAYYISTVFLFIFGHSIQAAVLSQSFFLLMLVLSVFFLGKIIKDEDLGFLSAISAITIPLVGQYSPKFYLDIPTMAVTAFAVLCLLKCEKFSNTLWSFLFFIAAAMGILTKLQFALYLAPPLAIVTVMFLSDLFKNTTINEKGVNILYLLSIPVSASLGYLLKRLMMDRFEPLIMTDVVHIAMRWKFFHELDKPGVFELNVLKWYLISLVPIIIAFVLVSIFKPGNKSLGNFVRGSILSVMLTWHFYGIYLKKIIGFSVSLQGGAGITANMRDFLILASKAMGSIFLLFLIVGICSFLFFKNRSNESNIVFTSLIFSIIIIYLFPRKEDRWFMPLMVYAAPIAVYWFLSLKWKYFRWVFSVVFLYFSIMNPFGWIIYESPVTAPYKYLNTIVRLELQKRNIFMSTFNYAPLPHGMDVGSISNIVSLAGKNRKNLLVWVTDLPQDRVDPAIFWTIAIYSRFEQNRQLKFINALFKWDKSGEVLIYLQLKPDSPGIGEKSYHCLLMTEETPDDREIEYYDNILVLCTRDKDKKSLLPQRFEQNLQELKIKQDYDLKINLGADSGMVGKNLETILLRIPVKPAESSLHPEPSPQKDMNKIPPTAPE